jgi:MYXO-CTERM domain-containing protein
VSLSGAADALTSAASKVKLAYHNSDAVDLLVAVEGQLTVKGTLEILPVVDATLPSLNNLHLVLPISVGAKKDYTNETAPVLVTFGPRTIHVPLPNVAVPTDDVDFGTIKSGTQSQKVVTLENTGELGALLSIESSDPRFSVDLAQFKMDSKSTHDLTVRFVPGHDGDASATITVKSNDPDSPAQTFKVKASSAPNAAPGNGDPGAGGGSGQTKPNDSSGCACHVTTLDASSTGGAGLLALGVVAFVRRRRKA